MIKIYPIIYAGHQSNGNFTGTRELGNTGSANSGMSPKNAANSCYLLAV